MTNYLNNTWTTSHRQHRSLGKSKWVENYLNNRGLGR